MRNPIQISNEEKESIRNSHSSFYNGYATGNVPSNLQPLRVDNSVNDHNGITVDNKGNVKQYTNHRVNEEQADDMDISDVDSADNFESGGPEQFDSEYSDESYGMDIDSIMNMFGDDMSSDNVDDEECTMNTDLDGKETYDNEESAYTFDSQGGDDNVYGEGDDEIEDDTLYETVKKDKKYINEMFNRLKKYN